MANRTGDRYSAALLRRDLDGIERAFPNHKRVVFIGHSMGGMICRLMITDAGDKIWRHFLLADPRQDPADSGNTPSSREAFCLQHCSMNKTTQSLSTDFVAIEPDRCPDPVEQLGRFWTGWKRACHRAAFYRKLPACDRK